MNMINTLKSSRVLSVLVAGMVFAGVMNIKVSTPTSPPLFDNLESFALFAQKEVRLDKEVQISSGDIGSNGKIDIKKDVILNGNTFSDQHVADMPDIPNFQPGKKDFKFEGQDNVLEHGNYRNITLEKNTRLMLEGGIYNIAKLDMREGSMLIYSAPTTLNIKTEFKTQRDISILPGGKLKPDDLAINFAGNKGPVHLGQESFLNFKLLAPKADVNIESDTTLRGQVVAEKVKIGKGTVVSREETFEKESDPAKVVENQGLKFIVNEIAVLFEDTATQSDIQQVADLVDGTITGFIPAPVIVKIEVKTNTAEELNNKIRAIKDLNSPLITEVVQNLVAQ